MSGSVLIISLNNVKFRAYHGLYPQEREKGNDFVVNAKVYYRPGTGTITDLSDTIDYAVLFQLVSDIMQRPVDLLETLVQEIALAFHHRYPQIHQAEISIEKMNPPIDAFEGSTMVTWVRVFE